MNKLSGRLSAAQIIMLGFLIIILIGAVLLSLPVCSAEGDITNFVDCLFTAASAVCITGLTTVTTAQHWSLAGQIVILVLIQIGGLGFMTFVSFVFLVLKKRMTLKERNVMQESLSLNEKRGITDFARYVMLFSFAAEGIGAAVLAVRFIPKYGALKGIYYSVFHAVSAYCNAGFDVFGSSSIIEYNGDIVVNITLMLLIVVGGLGFIVNSDIISMLKNIFINKFSIKFSVKKLRLHTKIAVLSTAFLIVSGTLLFTVLEYGNPYTIGNMPFGKKVLVSAFQSVTLRTAGFISVEQINLSYASKLIGCVFMLIGGSPAGTAGGAKTVTAAVILIAILSVTKGSRTITVFKRSISFETVQKALSVIVMMLILFVFATIVLTVSDGNLLIANGGEFELIDLMYEVVSAIGTVGISVGMTPYFSAAGKLMLIVCMYIGRVGPVSLAIALSLKKSSGGIGYPEDKIMVG